MNEDTRLLLKECDAGTKMAVDTIDQVLPSIHSSDFKNGLKKYRDAHVSFGDKLHARMETKPRVTSASWPKLPPAL